MAHDSANFVPWKTKREVILALISMTIEEFEVMRRKYKNCVLLSFNRPHAEEDNIVFYAWGCFVGLDLDVYLLKLYSEMGSEDELYLEKLLVRLVDLTCGKDAPQTRSHEMLVWFNKLAQPITLSTFKEEAVKNMLGAKKHRPFGNYHHQLRHHASKKFLQLLKRSIAARETENLGLAEYCIGVYTVLNPAASEKELKERKKVVSETLALIYSFSKYDGTLNEYYATSAFCMLLQSNPPNRSRLLFKKAASLVRNCILEELPISDILQKVAHLEKQFSFRLEKPLDAATIAAIRPQFKAYKQRKDIVGLLEKEGIRAILQ